MVIVGIISEYNPFHNGHLYQIETIRSRFGPDCAVIAIMSGNFVQRGEAAVLDKWSRTRAALLCGVNLVIELPAVYATGSAERFADGGVALAAACGLCDHLVFGSESGDLVPLEAIADILAFEPALYQQALRSCLDLGLSYAVSRVRALGSYAPSLQADVILSTSNNILAVEYLKALKRRNITDMKPYTIRREGQGYKETGLYNKSLTEQLHHLSETKTSTLDSSAHFRFSYHMVEHAETESDADLTDGLPDPGILDCLEPGLSFWSASAIRAYAETLLPPGITFPGSEGLLVGGISLPGSEGPLVGRISPHPTASLLQTLSDAMPVPSLAIFADKFHRKECIVSREVFADSIFTRLSSLSVGDMVRIPGMQEGLGARLKEFARRNPGGSTPLQNAGGAVSFSEEGKTLYKENKVLHRESNALSMLIDHAATKRFPKTRVRRALLHMILGLEKEDLDLFDNEKGPFYLRILGFDKTGRYLLKRMRTTATLPILMKGSDFLEYANNPENRALKRMAELDRIATDLWMFKINQASGQDFTTPPISFLRSPRRSVH